MSWMVIALCHCDFNHLRCSVVSFCVSYLLQRLQLGISLPFSFLISPKTHNGSFVEDCYGLRCKCPKYAVLGEETLTN